MNITVDKEAFCHFIRLIQTSLPDGPVSGDLTDHTLPPWPPDVKKLSGKHGEKKESPMEQDERDLPRWLARSEKQASALLRRG